MLSFLISKHEVLWSQWFVHGSISEPNFLICCPVAKCRVTILFVWRWLFDIASGLSLEYLHWPAWKRSWFLEKGILHMMNYAGAGWSGHDWILGWIYRMQKLGASASITRNWSDFLSFWSVLVFILSIVEQVGGWRNVNLHACRFTS